MKPTGMLSIQIYTIFLKYVYCKYYKNTIILQKHRKDGNWDCGPCFVHGNCPKSKKQIKPCLTELSSNELIEGIDFYWEEIEGVRLRVFTEEYLKMIRPKCCQSACRHCPWNFKK